MATLNFNQSTENTESLASAKFTEFAHTNQLRTSNKTAFSQIPVFYQGEAVKEHFPYKKDADGKKIPKKDSKAKFTEYEKEDTSDGWQFALHTPGRDTLYVVVKDKPVLEVGAYYLVSGLGYGNGQYPTFLDENIDLELMGRISFLENGEVVIKNSEVVNKGK